jgi:hypothetical protein
MVCTLKTGVTLHSGQQKKKSGKEMGVKAGNRKKH